MTITHNPTTPNQGASAFPPPAPPAPKRNKGPIWAAAIVILVAALLAVIFVHGNSDKTGSDQSQTSVARQSNGVAIAVEPQASTTLAPATTAAPVTSVSNTPGRVLPGTPTVVPPGAIGVPWETWKVSPSNIVLLDGLVANSTYCLVSSTTGVKYSYQLIGAPTPKRFVDVAGPTSDFVYDTAGLVIKAQVINGPQQLVINNEPYIFAANLGLAPYIAGGTQLDVDLRSFKGACPTG